MHSPFDYSLCNQTVTVYRMKDGRISRNVYDNCYLDYETRVDTDTYGQELERRFTLILPGTEQLLQPEDRIYAGQGPALYTLAWEDFIPAKVEGLMQVQYIKPCFWNGKICHTEAGNKGGFRGFGG